jgi:hypothetical protein
MSIEAVFIFIAPEADPAVHTVVVETPIVRLRVVGVKTYAEAATAAVAAVEGGVTAIELCAGFGNQGVATIARAVGARARVGVVRFDPHPGLGFESGDTVFA